MDPPYQGWTPSHFHLHVLPITFGFCQLHNSPFICTELQLQLHFRTVINYIQMENVTVPLPAFLRAKKPSRDPDTIKLRLL